MVEPLQNVLGRVIPIHTVIFLMCRYQRVRVCAANLAMPSILQACSLVCNMNLPGTNHVTRQGDIWYNASYRFCEYSQKREPLICGPTYVSSIFNICVSTVIPVPILMVIVTVTPWQSTTDGRTSPSTFCDYFNVQVPKGFMYAFGANLCNAINFFENAVLYVVLLNPFGMGSNYFLIKGYHATMF